MVAELYSDQRAHEFQGSSRFVSHPRACAAGGGTFAISKDGSRCIVAGNEVLRILRIRDPGYAQTSAETGSRMVVGPGGSTIETTTNMWGASGLKVDSAPTDVIWAHGIFDNRIVTSARNGEIIYWDLNKSGSKYDSRVKEHTRAINKLALSPCLHYLFASGAQDGYLRLWDLRTPHASTMRVYHATAIRAIAFCPVPSHPYHICVGLESGNIQRWDLRNKAQPIERITLAHSSAILSMDWQSPSINETGLGWIVTSGMDKRVKVWDLCVNASVIPSTTTTTVGNAGSHRDKLPFTKKMGPRAFRVLGTPFPVRSVKWRPGNDTEVGIISNNDSENDTVEIWDIRRGWIGKWSLEGVENAITDFAFCGSHKIWAQHLNGSFVQHDLRDTVRPLDAITRVSATWSADGSLAFVGNHSPQVEVPYDDIHPHRIGSIQAGRVHVKTTVDPVYQPYGEQALGVLHISPLDASTFRRLARAYILDGDSRTACQHNAEVAAEAGHYDAAQTWRLLYSLLLNMGPDEMVYHAPSTSSQVPAAQQPSSAAASIRSQQRAQESQQAHHQSSTSMTLTLNNHTRHSTPSPRPTPLPLQQQQQSSPGHRHESPAREISPVSMMYDASMSSSRSSVSISVSLASRDHSRRASSVAPGRMLSSRPSLRRASISSPHALTSVDHVGEGALDDSDSEEHQEDGGEEQELVPKSVVSPASASVSWMTGRSRGNSAGGGAGRMVGRHVPSPSPLSRVVARAAGAGLRERGESPDGHLASDERSIGEFDEEDSEEGEEGEGEESRSATESASGEDEEAVAEKGRVQSRRRGSATSVAHSSISSKRRLHLTKQESQSSIRTVTATVEGHRSVESLHEQGLASIITSDNVTEGSSTRRPSPQYAHLPARSSVSSHHLPLGLGLSVSSHHAGSSYPSHSHSLYLNSPMVVSMLRQPTAAHIAAAREYRQIAWRALDDMLERYAEAGDVMMCAGLVCVAPRKGGKTQVNYGKGGLTWGLSVDEERAARMVEAFIDLLDRHQLHVLAADIRKSTPFQSVGRVSQAQTTFYASCGKCGTSVRALNSSPVLCEDCKALATLCVIWTSHIPVRTLLMHCSTCGHGGHPTCLRRFYAARRTYTSTNDVILSGSNSHPHQNTSSGGTTTDSTSVSDRETVYFSWSDGDGGHGKVVAGSDGGGAAAGEDASTMSGETSNEDEHSSSPNASVGVGSNGIRGAETEEMGLGIAGQGLGHGTPIKVGGQGQGLLRLRVVGYPCAAGCGHWCWATGEKFGS